MTKKIGGVVFCEIMRISQQELYLFAYFFVGIYRKKKIILLKCYSTTLEVGCEIM